MFYLPVDEDQLRAKGYDKTPDFILQVPVGKSLNSTTHLLVEKRGMFFSIPFFCVLCVCVNISKFYQSRLSL
jgi:hypothetical protein